MTIASQQDLDTQRGTDVLLDRSGDSSAVLDRVDVTRHFSKTQRGLAWVWLAIYTTALVFYHGTLLGFMPPWTVSYPAIAMRLNLALLVWLVFRLGKVRGLVAFTMGVLSTGGIMESLMVPTWNMIEKTMPGLRPLIFAPAAVLAVMHLLLDPVRRWYQNRQASSLRWD